MRVVEKRQLLSAEEIDRTLQRLAHEIVEKAAARRMSRLSAYAAEASR